MVHGIEKKAARVADGTTRRCHQFFLPKYFHWLLAAHPFRARLRNQRRQRGEESSRATRAAHCVSSTIALIINWRRLFSGLDRGRRQSSML